MSHKQSDPEAGFSSKRAKVPTHLAELMRYTTDCDCGRTHSVDTVHCVVRKGAMEELTDVAKEIGKNLSIGMVVDKTTREIAGQNAADLMQRAGHRITICTVPDGPGGRPHADQANLELVEQSIRGSDLAIAVGSGTLNDLTKLCSFKQGIPYVVIATAPSMNGYTSAIAAISVKGVKRTIECHQPYGVIGDITILLTAPAHLVAAGIGDLESKPTALSDFRLSARLRGTYYCKAPESVVLNAEERVAAAAAEIGRGDPEAIGALMEALLLSGISMKLAGSSSPASGGEHLMSHYWDMTAAEENRIEGWHGAQVGVCTIVTAALYKRIQQVSPDDIIIDKIIAARLSKEQILAQLRTRHGSHADEVAVEYFQKQLSDDDLRAKLDELKSDWYDIWQGLEDILRPPTRIRDTLKAAGAPVTVQELGLTPEHLRKSYIAAREIRNRFTVLDLAAEMGMLENLQEDVIGEVIG